MTAPHPFVVIDANVLLYSLTGNARRHIFEPYLVGATVLISFQTVGEIKFIALRRKWGAQKMSDLDQHLRATVVVPATEAITNECAQLMYRQQAARSEIAWTDAWIAATALVYGCPVVTNDRGDFERIAGLPLLPPLA